MDRYFSNQNLHRLKADVDATLADYVTIDELKNRIKDYTLTYADRLKILYSCINTCMYNVENMYKVIPVLGLQIPKVEAFIVNLIKKEDWQLPTLIDRMIGAKGSIPLPSEQEARMRLLKVLISRIPAAKSHISYLMMTEDYGEFVTDRLKTFYGKDFIKIFNPALTQVFLSFESLISFKNNRRVKTTTLDLIHKNGMTAKQFLSAVVAEPEASRSRRYLLQHYEEWGRIAQELKVKRTDLLETITAILNKPDNNIINLVWAITQSCIETASGITPKARNYLLKFFNVLSGTLTEKSIIRKATENLKEDSTYYKNNSDRNLYQDIKSFVFTYIELAHTELYRVIKNIYSLHDEAHENFRQSADKVIAKYSNRRKAIRAYHRTRSLKVGRKIRKAGFKAGSGAMYGKGIYFTYNIQSQMNDRMIQTYGPVVVRVTINLDNYVIFDRDLGKLVYGDDYTPEKHIKEMFGIDIEFDEPTNSVTSDHAYQFYHSVPKNQLYLLNGIVFTGRQDGRTIAAYRYDNIKMIGQATLKHPSKKINEAWAKENMQILEESRVK